MSLNVSDLLRRAQLSATRGYQIALGDHYAEMLGGKDGSPAGLIELCKRALAASVEAAPTDAQEEPPTLVPTALVPVEGSPEPAAPSETTGVASPVDEPSRAPVEPPAPAVAEPAAPLEDSAGAAAPEASLSEAKVEAPAEETVEAKVEAPAEETVEATEESHEGEGEAVEAEGAEVAKDPADGSSKRRRRRR